MTRYKKGHDETIFIIREMVLLFAAIDLAKPELRAVSQYAESLIKRARNWLIKNDETFAKLQGIGNAEITIETSWLPTFQDEEPTD